MSLYYVYRIYLVIDTRHKALKLNFLHIMTNNYIFSVDQGGRDVFLREKRASLCFFFLYTFFFTGWRGSFRFLAPPLALMGNGSMPTIKNPKVVQRTQVGVVMIISKSHTFCSF